MSFFVPTRKSAKLQISRFDGGMSASVCDNLLPQKNAKVLFNMDAKKGGLAPGMGLSLPKLAHLDATGQELFERRIGELDNPTHIAHFRRLNSSGERADYLVALCGSRLVAVDMFHPSNANRVFWTDFLGEPSFINYNLFGTDVLLVSSAETKLVVWDGENSAYMVADAPDISSMALHYERLFATSTKDEQNTVWFSDDLDPTNWTTSLQDAGFIRMLDERGASQKVVSFLDYVFVFREYGISRISGYGDQTQFLVSQLSTQTGKIFPNTVTLCGNVILFLAEDGVYAFDGLSAKKILPELAGFLERANNSSAIAAAGEGKWYLLCNFVLDEDGTAGETKQVLVEYDLDAKKACVGFGLGTLSLCSVRLESGSQVLAVAQVGNQKKVLSIDHSGAVLGTTLQGIWKSAWTDLGMPGSTKTLRKLNILKSTTCRPTVTIETESKSGVSRFDAAVCDQTVLTNLAGRRFRFTISCDAKTAHIESFSVKMSIRD